MKIYQLLHRLIDKFAPMDDSDSLKLESKASQSYGEVLLDAVRITEENEQAKKFNLENAAKIEAGKETEQAIKVLTLKHKAVLFCDLWWMQYIFGILFIIAVPKIKSIMNGESRSDGDDDGSDFEDYMEYKRFKETNR